MAGPANSNKNRFVAQALFRGIHIRARPLVDPLACGFKLLVPRQIFDTGIFACLLDMCKPSAPSCKVFDAHLSVSKLRAHRICTAVPLLVLETSQFSMILGSFQFLTCFFQELAACCFSLRL